MPAGRAPPQMDSTETSPEDGHDSDSPDVFPGNAGNAGDAVGAVGASSPAEWRRFQAKRPHKKSRAGCLHCKARKVKCDEARPQCRACRMRREACVYAEVNQNSQLQVLQVWQVPQSLQPDPLAQPLFRPSGFDLIDMRLLWYYTAKGYHSFTTGTRHADEVSEVLQVSLPHQAFASRFLMDCLLALSAVELQANGQDQGFGLSSRRVLAYRARAFAGYRAALEAETSETDIPRPAPAALLACSLLLCALSTHMFRDEDARPLCLPDWMAVWRGISLVIQLITPRVLPTTGVVQLLVRLPVNLDAAARHVPNALLFMVSTLQSDEPDYPHAAAYYMTLQFLGSLFQELRATTTTAAAAAAFSPSETFVLRTVTWATFLPQAFLTLARTRQPRALIILAYYLCFIKLCRQPWWIQGIADKEIRDIADILQGQSAWQTLLQVPLAAIETDDAAAIAQLLLGDQDCTPDTTDTFNTFQAHNMSSHNDTALPPPEHNFALVDSTGHVLVYRDRWVQVDTGRPAIWNSFPAYRSAETPSSSPSTTYDSPEIS